MKQKQINGYQPKYPKKLLRGAVLTAAALVAIGGAACEHPVALSGDVVIDEPTEEPLVLDGEVAIDESEDTDDLLLGGEPLPEESPEAESHVRDGDLVLEGKIVVDDGNP